MNRWCTVVTGVLTIAMLAACGHGTLSDERITHWETQIAETIHGGRFHDLRITCGW